MLARNGRTTLAQDGYAAYHAIAEEDTTIPAESIIRYAEQLARVDARVGEFEVRLKAMAINPQPLGLMLTLQLSNYEHQVVRALPGFYEHQEYRYFAP